MAWYEWIIVGAAWMLIPGCLLLKVHLDHQQRKGERESLAQVERILAGKGK